MLARSQMMSDHSLSLLFGEGGRRRSRRSTRVRSRMKVDLRGRERDLGRCRSQGGEEGEEEEGGESHSGRVVVVGGEGGKRDDVC